MWTPTTRQKHSRTVTRYQTDLTDTEWRVIAPHLPKPCRAGRPRERFDETLTDWVADIREHDHRGAGGLLQCHYGRTASSPRITSGASATNSAAYLRG
jgi:transposase